MKRLFAALRFLDDGNLSDRVYWYLAGLSLSEGEEVLAPVGMHDRLQRARVERTLLAEEEDAPYPVSSIKRVEARFGTHSALVGGVPCTEFGGIRYDDRHYTRFGTLLYAEREPADPPLPVLVRPERGDAEVYAAIRRSGALLVGGEGKEIARLLLSALRGGEEALAELNDLLGESACAALLRRLG